MTIEERLSRVLTSGRKCSACGGQRFRVYEERCLGEYTSTGSAFIVQEYEEELIPYAECLECGAQEFLRLEFD